MLLVDGDESGGLWKVGRRALSRLTRVVGTTWDTIMPISWLLVLYLVQVLRVSSTALDDGTGRCPRPSLQNKHTIEGGGEHTYLVRMTICLPW